MASQKYILTEIKKGYNLSWYVCSQCYYAGTIKLYDDTGKVYFTCSKTSGSTSYQSLAQGHDDFTGNELYLSVEIPQSTKIQQSITANSVTDAHAAKSGDRFTASASRTPPTRTTTTFISTWWAGQKKDKLENPDGIVAAVPIHTQEHVEVGDERRSKFFQGDVAHVIALVYKFLQMFIYGLILAQAGF